MRPAAVLLLPLFAAFLGLLCRVDAKCDPNVVGKIKALNVDTANILDKLNGEYAIVYVEVSGMPSSNYEDRCIKIKFFKEGATRKIHYQTMMKGAYTLQEKHGTFVHLGTEFEPDHTYYPIINSNDMFAAYVCDDQEDGKDEEEPGEGGEKEEPQSTGLSYVAVPVGRSPERLTEAAEAAVTLMTSLGLPRGAFTYGCFGGGGGGGGVGGGGGGGGGCTYEERSYHVISCR